MRTLFYAVIIGGLLLTSSTQAEGLKVEENEREFVTKFITAKNVKGVRIGLSTLAFVDCNMTSLSLKHTLISGEGNSWYDKYLLEGDPIKTLRLCPPEDKPVLRKISSRKIFIKSFSNEEINNEVRLFVVIPKGYELEVFEVKLFESEDEN